MLFIFLSGPLHKEVPIIEYKCKNIWGLEIRKKMMEAIKARSIVSLVHPALCCLAPVGVDRGLGQTL